MALLTAKQISTLVVPLLTRSIALPMTMSRVPGGEFSGANGDTISVRVRTPRSANTQAVAGSTITTSGISETSVDVSLAHLYDAVDITDEELSLQLVEYGVQVAEPQVAAVAVAAEDQAAAAINGVAADASFAADATEADTEDRILEAREALSSANVPTSNRYFVVSSDIATRVLSVEKFVRVDAAGSDSALREGIIGRLYGFTFVESNALTAGTACAYHRAGFAFANRTPVPPRSNSADSFAQTQSGIGMRTILQYNPSTLTDQSVLSTFAGAALVDADMVFKLDTGA